MIFLYGFILFRPASAVSVFTTSFECNQSATSASVRWSPCHPANANGMDQCFTVYEIIYLRPKFFQNSSRMSLPSVKHLMCSTTEMQLHDSVAVFRIMRYLLRNHTRLRRFGKLPSFPNIFHIISLTQNINILSRVLVQSNQIRIIPRVQDPTLMPLHACSPKVSYPMAVPA